MSWYIGQNIHERVFFTP